jgi:uncharacterized protein RhaS with RHS repeats
MYISQDPIKLSGGFSLYSYVKDTNAWVDRFGLESCNISIETDWGDAEQSNSPEAIVAREQVENGAILYKLGTMRKSETETSQFWALENPLSNPDYANKYGIPQQNVDNSDFIMTATLKPESKFITRPAPPVGENAGGGIEVVVPKGGVNINSFSTL